MNRKVGIMELTLGGAFAGVGSMSRAGILCDARTTGACNEERKQRKERNDHQPSSLNAIKFTKADCRLSVWRWEGGCCAHRRHRTGRPVPSLSGRKTLSSHSKTSWGPFFFFFFFLFCGLVFALVPKRPLAVFTERMHGLYFFLSSFLFFSDLLGSLSHPLILSLYLDIKVVCVLLQKMRPVGLFLSIADFLLFVILTGSPEQDLNVKVRLVNKRKTFTARKNKRAHF